MTLFRHRRTNRVYRLYRCSPRMYTGSWYESEDLLSGEVRPLNQSSWTKADFIPFATR